MNTGVVRRLAEVRKRGIIIYGMGNDIFFRFADIQKGNLLKRGDRVKFELESDSSGLKAVNIRKIC